jgi:hypothetical protein
MERDEEDKLNHKAVGYEHPSDHSDDRCGRCAHFVGSIPPRCEAVKSPILAEDWCKRFSPKKSMSLVEVMK